MVNEYIWISEQEKMDFFSYYIQSFLAGLNSLVEKSKRQKRARNDILQKKSETLNRLETLTGDYLPARKARKIITQNDFRTREDIEKFKKEYDAIELQEF